MTTINDLRRWLETLPPEFDNADVEATLSYGGPSPMKRAVAYRYKVSGECGVVFNQLGTHLNDAFYEDVEIVSVLPAHPKPKQP